MSQQLQKRWLLDYEVAEATEGRITASRLRKDRLGAQLFPFHRVGRSVYYDLAEVNSVIEASRFGGDAAPTSKVGRSKVAA